MIASLAMLLPLAGCASTVNPGYVPDGALAADGALVDLDGAPGPGGVSEGRRIANLSPGEALQWCTWFHSLHDPGADRNVTGPDANGFRHYIEYWGCGLQPTSYYMPELTMDDCLANLTVHPCVATIGDLDACVLAHRNGCDIESSCVSFHAQRACATTILQAVPYAGPSPNPPLEILVPVR
jgi:hypothetical protein